MDRISVAVVDDHPLFREGVVRALSDDPDIDVVAQGGSAKEAMSIADRLKPDILTLDLSIPGGGIAALQAIATTHAETKVLVLSISDSSMDVAEAFRAGARGYLAKGMRASELLNAVRLVSQGEQYLSSELGAKLVSKSIHGSATLEAKDSSRHPKLRIREAQILTSVKDGLSNKLIAAKLGLSDKTIKHYMPGLFHKLGVHSRLEAALVSTEPAPVEAKPKPKAVNVSSGEVREVVGRPSAAHRQFLGLEYDRRALRKGA
jgi:DNA-binding NarL/FixJ family response regulator